MNLLAKVPHVAIRDKGGDISLDGLSDAALFLAPLVSETGFDSALPSFTVSTIITRILCGALNMMSIAFQSLAAQMCATGSYLFIGSPWSSSYISTHINNSKYMYTHIYIHMHGNKWVQLHLHLYMYI